jgi:hypothetical protein
MQPVLSILICSLYKRAGMLAVLLGNLYNQIEKLGAEDKVEVLVEADHGETPTGTKRNILMEQASGVYVTAIDDDDSVPDYYIEEILKAAELDCDAMAINGIITTDSVDEKQWFISKDNQYKASFDENGKEYYDRYQNHISPIKRAIATQFKFLDIFQGEDFNWATRIRDSGLIQTEAKIEKPMYHYKFVRLKKV